MKLCDRLHFQRTLLAFGLALATVLGACGGTESQPPEQAPPQGESEDASGESLPAEPPADDEGGEVAERNPALLDPTLATEQAPANFTVRFETTGGDFSVRVNREWSPRGADRFYNLVRIGFFEDLAFFRVVEGFVIQFGIHGDPEIARLWRQANIQDDPVREPNRRGTLVFATAGPNTRSTQFFINLGDNGRGLDSQGFSPLGEVVDGMEVVDGLYSGYGERPNQSRIQTLGNEYLGRDFPNLDYIKSATILE